MHSMARFQYNNLPLDEREIRLLKLLPASPSTSVQAVKTQLIKCSINRPPAFKALSYTWGHEDIRRDIEVGDATLSITASLELALRALRSEIEPVLLWIDQICIDQGDLAEKNAQIPLMTQIYSVASLTIGWLGEAPPYTEVASALNTLDGIGARGLDLGLHSITANQYRLLYTDEMDNAFGTTYALVDDIRNRLQRQFEEMGDFESLPGFDGMVWIFDNQYFKRGWIQQEIAIPEIMVFKTSQGEIDADKLVAATFLLELYRHHTVGRSIKSPTASSNAMTERTHSTLQLLQAHLHPCLAIRRQYQLSSTERYFNLASILRKYRRLQFRNDGDRVYGTLGLAKDFETLGVQVSVGLSWEDIFIDTARRIILSEIDDDDWRGGANFMALCDHRKTSPNLPSWVPDLRNIGSLMTLAEATTNFSAQPFNASRGFGQHTTEQPPNARIISCSGIMVDVINEVGNLWSESKVNEIMSNSPGSPISDIKKFAKQSATIVASDPDSRHPHRSDQARLLEAAWKVPIMDQEFGGSPVANRRATDYSLRGYTTLMNRHGNRAAFLSYVTGLEPLKSRRPFLGRNGFVGICPVVAQAGDAVCVLRGGKFPFVVRKVVPETGAVDLVPRFELVGEAYCHGIMDGEALKMSLAIEELTLE